MKKLITISREYGSGGRIVGKLLAEKLELPFYDKAIIDIEVEKRGFSSKIVENAELRAKSSFSYSLASAINFGDGVTSNPLSINEKIFLAQFDVIKSIGDLGEGVIVGRCADYILKGIEGVTNVFIYADIEDRIRRSIEIYGDDPQKVKEIVATYDKARQNYYNYHTSQKWGDYKNFNLAINSSYIGEKEIVSIIIDYLKMRSYK